MEALAAAFKAVVEEASKVAGDSTAGVACALAAEAGLEGGHIRHLLLATQDHALQLLLLCAQAVGSQRGLVTTTPGPGAISRAEISGLEILPRRPQQSLTAGGILLAAQLEAVDLPADSRQQGPRAMVAAFTCLAGVADRDLPARSVAFRGKAAKSGRTLPPREMLFAGLNRFLPYTIPSTAQSPLVPDSRRIGRFPHLLDSPEGQPLLALLEIEVFQVA